MIDNTFFGWTLPNFQPAMLNMGQANADYLNNCQVMDVFNRLTNIALSRFKWKGLPITCNERALEETLYFYGRAVFFDDYELGYCHTPVSLTGPFNIYFESIKRRAYSFDNFQRDLTIYDSVLIKNNHTMTPDYMAVWSYAPKIANALRAIDVHLETLKRPFMIQCLEKEKPSVERALNDIFKNKTVVVGTKLADANKFQVIDLNVQSHLTDFWSTAKNYFNQVFNELGIRNNFSEKRERLVTTEVQGEENSTRHALEAALNERQIACEEINQRFGLNVSVEANELNTFAEEYMQMQAAKVTGMLEAGGDENGNV